MGHKHRCHRPHVHPYYHQHEQGPRRVSRKTLIAALGASAIICIGLAGFHIAEILALLFGGGIFAELTGKE